MMIEVPRHWVRPSFQFGQQSVDAYMSGRKNFSRDIQIKEKPLIHDNPHVQAWGRIAEVAVCIAFKLVPLKALNWGRECDGGADLSLPNGKRVDVKATDHPNGRRLIWPKPKDYLLTREKRSVDILLFARLKRPVLQDAPAMVRLAGWITSDDFITRAKIADADNARGVVPGSRFMHEDDLNPNIERMML